MTEKEEQDQFNRKTYSLTISAQIFEDPNKIFKTDVLFLSSEIGMNLLFKFFELIKNESLNLVGISTKYASSKEFDLISEVLFQNFNERDVDSDGLDNAISRKLEKLKESNFLYPPKYFNDAMLSLRTELITFWEYIIKRYHQRKDDFVEEFKKRMKKFYDPHGYQR